MSQTESKQRPVAKLHGLLAEFESPGALKAAAVKIRDAGFKNWDCHSPFPVHGLDPAMGIKMTILPLLVFGAGITGCALGIILQWGMNAFDWPWIIAGKPYFSLPAQIPIAFELTVLLSAFATFFGMWGLNQLPKVWHPLFGNDRFMKASDDGFFVAIDAIDPKFSETETKALLLEAGAIHVEACRYVTSNEHRQLPKEVTAFILITALLGLVPFAFIYKARLSKSSSPHFHVVPNMDFQPKFGAQDTGSGLPAVFEKGQTGRVAPNGTVARGELRADNHLHRGIVDGKWAQKFPPSIEISDSSMERGKRQFEIYCRPCHGDDGQGNGMIHVRASAVGAQKTGWNQPTNINEADKITQPHGQLYNTITYGIRTMQGYGSQISVEDRWHIVLYLRALQRATKTPLGDLPKDVKPR